MKKTRVLILGGGFGGLYAALEFEKRVALTGSQCLARNKRVDAYGV
jgi:NADH dehydrogenase FAD-containing subunit